MLRTSLFHRHCNRGNVSTNHRSNTPQTIRISSSIAPPSIRMVWASNSQRLPLAVQLNHRLGSAAKNHRRDLWWFPSIAAASGPQLLASSAQTHNNQSSVFGWSGLGRNTSIERSPDDGGFGCKNQLIHWCSDWAADTAKPPCHRCTPLPKYLTIN
jgi:hypothetical protein